MTPTESRLYTVIGFLAFCLMLTLGVLITQPARSVCRDVTNTLAPGGVYHFNSQETQP